MILDHHKFLLNLLHILYPIGQLIKCHCVILYTFHTIISQFIHYFFIIFHNYISSFNEFCININPFVTTRDYSRVSIKSLTGGLCDVIAAVIQQETHPPYTSCLANRGREIRHICTAHTAAYTKQGVLNNCNVYMSQVVYRSVQIFLTQILFKSVNIHTEEGYWLKIYFVL